MSYSIVRPDILYTNDNVGLYYEEAGTGHDVVLIPGATASIVWWQRNFGPLSKDFHMVAVDMRGWGRSEPS